MKNHAFDNLDAHDLDLYIINLANDGSLIEKAKELLASHSPLNPTDKLSAVFQGPPEDGIVHILVKPPQTGEFLRTRRITGLTQPATAAENAPMERLSGLVSFPKNLIFNPTERGSRAFTASLLEDESIVDATTSVPPFLDQLRAKLKAKRSINDKQRV